MARVILTTSARRYTQTLYTPQWSTAFVFTRSRTMHPWFEAVISLREQCNDLPEQVGSIPKGAEGSTPIVRSFAFPVL